MRGFKLQANNWTRRGPLYPRASYIKSDSSHPVSLPPGSKFLKYDKKEVIRGKLYVFF